MCPHSLASLPQGLTGPIGPPGPSGSNGEKVRTQGLQGRGKHWGSGRSFRGEGGASDEVGGACAWGQGFVLGSSWGHGRGGRWELGVEGIWELGLGAVGEVYRRSSGSGWGLGSGRSIGRCGCVQGAFSSPFVCVGSRGHCPGVPLMPCCPSPLSLPPFSGRVGSPGPLRCCRCPRCPGECDARSFLGGIQLACAAPGVCPRAEELGQPPPTMLGSPGWSGGCSQPSG